ncbi:TetR/AcrR family transcriptional regulator [Pseudohalocynthiibacter aestuariivivens]|jgi:AcrR family transcriptional regulator|uniref:TetR/AcrR family transcriptional regulator n=1 Tax=Pseudohalocynthiibacter aestuariivivens TaxID=1591409 RepID=A0ABV5JI28_9RHOB|nr:MULTISPECIES: TetR/AcrR family transcriptional regulator [Pseudohalocynthiibacter]MBS9717421.1 TetR/AcrR family transcriptional regulator [Pseudohalocynthiibacter aestuariivivens]MCK0102245.1 TetR/AcrR family transcriptional regulator [Pseudohalocynthiibacter sp. F2068]
MNMLETDTRTRLIKTAARLFREKGFHGTGIAEILLKSETPKGSLYHHFPAGKADLAKAAASWASEGMLEIIDAAFEGASDFQDGATTLCYKLAKFFDTAQEWQSCPVSSALFDGPGNEEFRDFADQIYTDWTESIIRQASRLGLETDDAGKAAETLLLAIQGGWTMARAKRSSDVLRRIPSLLYG